MCLSIPADPAERAARAARDDALAAALRRGGTAAFCSSWYQAPMWDSLRRHPCFGALLHRRAGSGTPRTVGQAARQTEGKSQEGLG
jgi:hypothetical protein